MIKSMTGFGRCELAEEGRKVTVEMKAVNHRYSEFSVKLPKRLNVCDVMVRNVLKQYISRGKVDVFVSYEDETEGKGCVKYNAELAKEYYDILMRMAEEFPIENDIRISGLSRYPEVLTIESAQQDEEALYINSGVMLMNLNLLRKEQNIEEVFDFIEYRKNQLILPDQDIISSLYGTKIYALDTFRYNMTENLFMLHAPFEKKLDLEWVRNNSVIIHYCGRNKPWKENYIGVLNTFYEETVSKMKIISDGKGET